jgi:hypothetical protein
MLNLQLNAEVSLPTVLNHAQQLADVPDDTDANVEYLRGQVELIASLFGTSDLDASKLSVVSLLGWPTEGIC